MFLKSSDRQFLDAAEGWLALGLPGDAAEELEKIEPLRRSHPDVLELRWRIYETAKLWREAAEVARGITRIAPDRFSGWWMLSFALHEMNRTQEAHDNLAGVREKFGAEYLLHYKLACYLTQIGRLDEARDSLKNALVLNPEQRTVALEDPDLQPLRTELQRW